MPLVTNKRFSTSLLGLLLCIAFVKAPGAAELVGAIPGSFDVSQTGVGTYTIPIELRTGTGGLRPSISLRYAHRGGHGIAGQNWTVSGVSRIDRCRKTLEQDAVAGGVKYTSTDSLCLDGRRLVVIDGTYGVAGSEYRTEIDSFKKIVAHGFVSGGPRYFVVTDRDGTKHWYGDQQQSSLTHPTTGAYRFWARYRTEDTYGNRINYSYSVNSISGEFLLDNVEYTSNPTQSLSSRYRVDFSYENRPASDERGGYRYGATWSRDKRLQKITHSLLGAGAGTIHEYTLSYATGASGRSQLVSIQQCRGVDCLAESTFAWQDAVAGWDNLTSTGHSSSGHGGPKVGDFNGDGQKDLFVVVGSNWHVLVASGGSLGAPFDTGAAAQDWSAAKMGDFDGDGKTDILFRGTDGDWHVYRSTGVATTGLAFTDIDTGESTSGVDSFALEDVDGDSRGDLLYQSGQNVYLRKSEGGDLDTTASLVYTSSSMTSISGSNTAFLSEPILDFDGDGLADLVENRVEVIDID
ncbi:MAG: FG-GAP-like repeat-containing protein, partial [Pseudomonadota bacterium]